MQHARTVLVSAALAMTTVVVGAVAYATTAGASASAAHPTTAKHEKLISLHHVTIDKGLTKHQADHARLKVRELYTFWDTGNTHYLYEADSPTFVDHTLPPGRKQGRGGIVEASKMFRTAVPDLRCTVTQVVIAGNRASVQQLYTGRFTGTYLGRKGHGQKIRFIAFDIQQLSSHRIVGDWHLEDNLTFMKEIGAVK